MKEDFLHYCWKFKKFTSLDFVLTSGEELVINHFGTHNPNQGPDFLHAEIEIAGVKWFGNIELHVNASDWNAHKHQLDTKYNSVVLHVVYEDDQIIQNQNGSVIPTLVLRDYIDVNLIESYEQFLAPVLPCKPFLQSIDPLVLLQFKDRLLIERLEEKSQLIDDKLKANEGDWLETFYQTLFKSFGTKVNQIAFQELAERTPLGILQRINDEQQIETLLLGNAGFLNIQSKDEYIIRSQKEYTFLKQKYAFKGMSYDTWKFSKMRPSNFPTIRIVQFAKLISSTNDLLSELVLDKPSYKTIKKILSIEISNGYWYNHYSINSIGRETKKSIGKQMINSIVINSIAPFAYYYGKHKDETYLKWINTLLEKVPVENNSITKLFNDLPLDSAIDSQSIIQNFNARCKPKKCLDCIIGIHLLGKKQDQ